MSDKGRRRRLRASMASVVLSFIRDEILGESPKLASDEWDDYAAGEFWRGPLVEEEAQKFYEDVAPVLMEIVEEGNE